MKHLFALGALVLAGSTAAAGPADQAARQATFLTELFTTSCAANLGDNKAISAWARQNRLIQASGQLSRAALQNRPGEVWGVPNPIGQFLVVLTGPVQCAVWARQASARVVNRQFEQVVKGLGRPGLTVTPYIDKLAEGAGGTYRQLGFVIRKEGASFGWVMLATTSESPRADVQARLTISPARL